MKALGGTMPKREEGSKRAKEGAVLEECLRPLIFGEEDVS